MKFKPLLITLPVLAIMLALFLLDQPHHSNEPIQDLRLNFVVGQTGDIVNDPGEPIYAERDENSEIVGTLQYNCCVLQNDSEPDKDWICVNIPKEPGDKSAGYVRANNVATESIRITCGDEIRTRIINDSLKYLGLKFKRYGQSLESGIDCSNFIREIFAKNERMVPDTPNGIMREGKRISRSSAQPGDIVYYAVNDGEGHVGLYLGNGYQINSSGHSGREYPEGGVRITKIKYHDREEPQFFDLLSK